MAHTFSFWQSVGILGGRVRGACWFYGAISDGFGTGCLQHMSLERGWEEGRSCVAYGLLWHLIYILLFLYHFECWRYHCHKGYGNKMDDDSRRNVKGQDSIVTYSSWNDTVSVRTIHSSQGDKGRFTSYGL